MNLSFPSRRPLPALLCVLAASMLLSLGCSRGRDPEEAAEAALSRAPSTRVAPPSTTQVQPPSAPRVRAAARPPASPSAAGANLGAGNPAAERLRGIGEVIAGMRRVAEAAAEAGQTPCEQAYLSTRAAVDFASEAEFPGNPEWRMLDREPFLSRCNELPENAQNCSRYDYRVDNREECDAAGEGLSPRAQAAFAALRVQTIRPER